MSAFSSLKEMDEYIAELIARTSTLLPRNATTTTSMTTPTMNPEIEKARQELEKLKQRERELEERLGSMYAGSHVTDNRSTAHYTSMNERNHERSNVSATGSPHRRNSSTLRERNSTENQSGVTSRFSSMYLENKSPVHTTFSDHINTKYESITSTEQTSLPRSPYESYKERRKSEDLVPRFTPLHTTNIEIERPSTDMLQMRSHIQEHKKEEEKYTTFSNSGDPRGNAYSDLANAMMDKKSPVTVYNRRTDAEELERKYPYPAKLGERRRSYDVKEEEDLNIVTKTEISNNPFDSSINDDNNGMSPHFNPHSSEVLKDIEISLNNYGSEESSSLSFTETTPLKSKEELINEEILDYLHKDEKLNSSDETEEDIDDGIVDLRHDIHREIQINQQRERELKCERNMDPSSDNSSDSEEESMQSIMSIRSKILKEIEEERQRDMEIQDQHRMRGLIPVVQANITSDYPDSLDDNSTVKNSDTEELFDAAEPHVENLPLDPVEYPVVDDDCLRSKDSESALHTKDDIDHEWLRLQREEELHRLRRVLSQDDMLGAETRDSESEFGEENFHSVDMRTKILKEIEEEQNREKELKMRFEREKKNVRRKSHNEIESKQPKQTNAKPIILNTRKEVPEKRIEQVIIDSFQENAVREEINGSDNFFNPRSLNDMNRQTFGSREDLIAYLGSSSESQNPKQKKVPQSTVQRITIPKVFTERTMDTSKTSKSEVHSNMRQVHESLLNSNLIEKHQYKSTESRQYTSTKDFDPVPTMIPPHPPTEKSSHTKHYVTPMSTPQGQTPPRRSSVTFLDDPPLTNSSTSRMANQTATPEKTFTERSKNPFLTDIEQSTNTLGNMYKYRNDYEEEHERRESETSILSHDVRDDGMERYTNPTAARQVEVPSITTQWNIVENHHKQKIEAALQNKETQRKKEKYDKSFYEKASPDIFPRKRHQPKQPTNYNSSLKQAHNPQPVYGRPNVSKRENQSPKHYSKHQSPHKISVKNTINGHSNGHYNEHSNGFSNDYSQVNINGHSYGMNGNINGDTNSREPTSGKGKGTSKSKSNGLIEHEFADAPKNVPPKAKEVTVAFTISKTIQRWEKRIKKNT